MNDRGSHPRQTLLYLITVKLISFLTPTNLEAEKEKFFASDEYNPQFEYDWDEQDIQAWLRSKPEYRPFVEAVLDQNYEKIVAEGEILFSTTVDEQTLSVAKQLTEHPPTRLETPPVEEIISAFEEAMQWLGIDYTMEVTDRGGFNFRPDHRNRKILMSSQVHLHYYTVDGEVRHELLHVIRNINSLHNNIPFSTSYLPTEEGLASYFQDYVGETTSSDAFQHAAEYLQTEHALNNSLRSCVNFWESLGFTRDLAWQRSIRHKYGFKDTSVLGDNMKPSMYFFWEQKIRQQTDNVKLRLLSGKIRLDEVSQFKEYSGEIEKDKLVTFYQLSV